MAHAVLFVAEPERAAAITAGVLYASLLAAYAGVSTTLFWMDAGRSGMTTSREFADRSFLPHELQRYRVSTATYGLVHLLLGWALLLAGLSNLAWEWPDHAPNQLCRALVTVLISAVYTQWLAWWALNHTRPWTLPVRVLLLAVHAGLLLAALSEPPGGALLGALAFAVGALILIPALLYQHHPLGTAPGAQRRVLIVLSLGGAGLGLLWLFELLSPSFTGAISNGLALFLDMIPVALFTLSTFFALLGDRTPWRSPFRDVEAKLTPARRPSSSTTADSDDDSALDSSSSSSRNTRPDSLLPAVEDGLPGFN